MSRPKANPDLPNGPGEKLLIAIARHHALTIEQAAYACGYAPTALSHVHEHLLRLLRRGYLRRVIPMERSLPPMFLLADRGKRFLTGLGVPYDEATGKKPPVGIHLAHRQQVTWVLLKIERSGWPILEMRNEWQLSRQATKLTLADGTTVGYAPDGWVRLLVDGREVSIAIELDRGVEEQKAWRRKVLEMVAFTDKDETGVYPFQRLFGTERIRFAVIAAPGAVGTTSPELRARNLWHWTHLELVKFGKTAWAPRFFVRPLDPRLITPEDLLQTPAWATPGQEGGQARIGGAA